MVVDRARKALEAIHKFIETGRTPTGEGRGKVGIAVRPTATGYAWLGKTPHGMRGGSSIQHEYWCNTIAGAVGGNIEATIGQKSVDVAINYDPSKHEGFLQLIRDTAHRLTDTVTEVRSGDVIAIEVETDGTKTALNNATKNAAVGIPLTIIAVHKTLLQTWTHLKEELDPSVWPHIALGRCPSTPGRGAEPLGHVMTEPATATEAAARAAVEERYGRALSDAEWSLVRARLRAFVGIPREWRAVAFERDSG